MIKFFRKQTHCSFVFFLVICLFPLLCVLAQADVSFRDVTTEMGIDFKHFNDFSPAHRLVETMGSGGVLFDFDRDGDLDIYLVQGNSLTDPNPNLINRLYRNDTQTFTDVTVDTA